MRVIPFEVAHLDRMTDFGQQEDAIRPFLDDLRDSLRDTAGPAFSGEVGEEIIGSAGLTENTPYRATVWAILPRQSNKMRFVAIHRAVRDFLARQTYRRIDAHVAINDPAGHRWAQALGFEREMLCRPWYGWAGETITPYVKWGRKR